jgi:hypothetical protein
MNSPKSEAAFHSHKFNSVKEALRNGFNEKFWRWGLVFNQGNEMNVSEERVRERLRVIAGRLLLKMYGKCYRKKAKIRFVVFKHGSKETHDQHFHAVMAIIGKDHQWSDWRITQTIRSIDHLFICGNRWEKPVHVDFEWKKGNRYHSYVGRFTQRSATEDDWFVI